MFTQTVSNMIEVWRAVVGNEGYYEVSNLGQVKSLNYNKTGQERILKPVDRGNGYLFVSLCKNGKIKHCSVHRLVGMAFADMIDWTEDAKGRPFEELEINHKDQNKQNNFVFVGEDGSADFQKSNLEWCDGKYNSNYGDRNERTGKATSDRQTGVYNTPKSKPVYQLTLDGEFVREWPSTMEIERQTGWRHGNIGACCRGKRKSAYGYVWKYK